MATLSALGLYNFGLFPVASSSGAVWADFWNDVTEKHPDNHLMLERLTKEQITQIVTALRTLDSTDHAFFEKYRPQLPMTEVRNIANAIRTFVSDDPNSEGYAQEHGKLRWMFVFAAYVGNEALVFGIQETRLLADMRVDRNINVISTYRAAVQAARAGGHEALAHKIEGFLGLGNSCCALV